MSSPMRLTEQQRTICVYCASSERCDPSYREVARSLGGLLAQGGCTLVYGGGRSGSMGALADGALAAGGRVIGVIPRFMQDLEWGHSGLSELLVVEDMRVRKHEMLTRASAVVALPGGCGTLEELFEAMTLKRLGIFLGPIVLLNTGGYYDPLLQQLRAAIDGAFMDERHGRMYEVVDRPEDVLAAISSAPSWSADSRSFAVQRALR